MKKLNYLLLLIPIILLFTFLIWFGNEMRPGGKFIENDYNQSESTTNNFPERPFKSLFQNLGENLKSLNENKIKAISTENGFKCILKISNNLKNTDILNNLSESLIHYKVYNIIENDSTLSISIGEQSEALGATGGYLFLKKDNGIYKINKIKEVK